MSWINIHDKIPPVGQVFIGCHGFKIFFCTRVLAPGLDERVVRGIYLLWDPEWGTWSEVSDGISYWMEGSFPPSLMQRIKQQFAQERKNETLDRN